MARENSSRAKYRSQNLPTEEYKSIGGTHVCSHGIDMHKHPDHDCFTYENERRAARGAPPLTRD